MNIHVPPLPARMRLSQDQITDWLWEPEKAIYGLFRAKLDVFQEIRVKHAHFGAVVEDSSGWGTGKTFCYWLLFNLWGVLLPDCHMMVIYQNWQRAKDQFWKYYHDPELMTLQFRCHIGTYHFEDPHRKDRRGVKRESGNWKVMFRTGSVLNLPAPDHLSGGESLGGMDMNRLLLDEYNKIMAQAGGFKAVAEQLLSRVRRACFNRDHPIWCNKTIKSSTAELGSHPAAPVHQGHLKEIEAGSPRHIYIRFDWKDYSELPSHTGKPFNKQNVDRTTLRDQKATLGHDDLVLAEQHGIYSQSGRGWFDAASVEAMLELGRRRNVRCAGGRAADESAKEHTAYFLGIDIAPSAREKNDDGFLAVLRANARGEALSDEESDFDLDYVLAERVKGRDIEWWSGRTHGLHHAFGFEIILSDHGGGGPWLNMQLAKERQVIEGSPLITTPIVPRDDVSVLQGHYILVPFTRKPLTALFPDLANARGDDKLKDFGNELFMRAVARGVLALPGPRPREEIEALPEALRWSHRLLTHTVPAQLKAYQVKMEADGLTEKRTGNGSRQFFSNLKDDAHDAARNAYLAFRLWLTLQDALFKLPPEQEARMGFRLRQAFA